MLSPLVGELKRVLLGFEEWWSTIKCFTSLDIGGTFIDFFYLRMAKVSITWYKNPRPTGTRTQGGWQTMRALYHRATGTHTRWRIDFSLELLYIQPTAKEFVPICVNYTLGANCNLVANRVQAGTRTRGCLHTVPMLYRWATESHNRGQIDIL